MVCDYSEQVCAMEVGGKGWRGSCASDALDRLLEEALLWSWEEDQDSPGFERAERGGGKGNQRSRNPDATACVEISLFAPAE